jgi:hypothetical protein
MRDLKVILRIESPDTVLLFNRNTIRDYEICLSRKTKHIKYAARYTNYARGQREKT